MKIIDELINELADKNNHLTDILIKTKVLAFKLKNQELIKWLDNELNGYTGEELPEYRKLACTLKGTISNGFQMVNNFTIPLISVEQEHKDTLRRVHLVQSISTLDEFVRREKGGRLSMEIPAELFGYLSQDFDDGFVIQQARREIDRVQVVQTLTSVRSKLLDFLLNLNEELGDTEDIKPLTEGEAKEKIASMFSSAVFGNNTTIIVGDHNSQTVTNVIEGNFESLKKVLQKNNVPESDITVLKNIIDNDNPSKEKKEFGDKVKGWMKIMIGKSVDTSWKIAIGAAGKLLADAIEIYYGWKH